jgi:hypothetical protein
MASSRTKSKAIRFTHPVEMRVRQLPIKFFSSLRNLDIARLSAAKRAEVELGLVKTSCCEQIVRAGIRNGKVVGVTIEPCAPGKKRQATPPELKRLLEASQKRIGRAAGGSMRFPMALKPFLVQAQSARGITVITCVEVCLFGYCIACCRQPNGVWICGHLTIDTTVGPYPE